jgi:hypothetical protein
MRALIVPLALLPDRAMVAVELKLAPSLATSKPVGAVAEHKLAVPLSYPSASTST